MAMVKEPTGFNQQINAVTFGPEVLPVYGYWACRALEPEIVANAKQSTLPILNKGNFSKLTVPVPPLDVQRRVAAHLDRAAEAAAALVRQQAVQAAQEARLTQSVLARAFAGEL